jgi:hypothetical protein
MRKYDTELPSRGGAGCYLSHLLAHKRLLESGHDAALIFEEAELGCIAPQALVFAVRKLGRHYVAAPPWAVEWLCHSNAHDASIPRTGVDKKVLAGVPGDWDVVLLGCHAVQGSGLVGTWRTIHRFVGLHAYAISAEGAKKILSSQVFPIVMQIDAYLSWMALRGQLKIYATRYNCVNQRMTKSDVQNLHLTQNSIRLGRYGFEHEPESGGSTGHLESSKSRLETLRASWVEVQHRKGETMGCTELKVSSWTWTPWGR